MVHGLSRFQVNSESRAWIPRPEQARGHTGFKWYADGPVLTQHLNPHSPSWPVLGSAPCLVREEAQVAVGPKIRWTEQAALGREYPRLTLGRPWTRLIEVSSWIRCGYNVASQLPTINKSKGTYSTWE